MYNCTYVYIVCMCVYVCYICMFLIFKIIYRPATKTDQYADGMFVRTAEVLGEYIRRVLSMHFVITDGTVIGRCPVYIISSDDDLLWCRRGV